MYDYNNIMFIFFAVVYLMFGIFVGSFLNVCIFRVPKKETVVTVPSHCMSCGHQLAWYDLFPVFSWLFLGGKCRYCKDKINPRYPFVELLNGVIWVLVYIRFGGLNFYSVIYCLMSSFMIVLSFIDIDEGIVPDGILLLFFIICIPVIIYDRTAWLSHIIGFFAVSVPLFIIMCLTGGMGGGDVKLYAVVGLFLGWKLTFVSLIICCVTASVFGIGLMLSEKKNGNENEKTAVRLVPFIFIGIFGAVFFGDFIINWYSGFFV